MTSFFGNSLFLDSLVFTVVIFKWERGEIFVVVVILVFLNLFKNLNLSHLQVWL